MSEEITVFRNARVLDGREEAALEDQDVVVEGNLIKDVTAERVSVSGTKVIDLGGKTLMPGLIDCHVHVIACLANLTANAELPNTLVSLRAAKIMHDMLMRGFTTVRDLGGADIGLKMAIEEGTIVGPRLIICGKALSQTGGHTDYRGRFHHRDVGYYADKVGTLGRVVDGVVAIRRVAREEIKGGAKFIKLMANGGVSSPTDPIAFLGFSRDETEAAVEEAENAQMYVAAHLYTDESIRRSVECGVKSVEHGNLIKPDTARFLKENGAFVVPTNVTFDMLANLACQAATADHRRTGIRAVVPDRCGVTLRGYLTTLRAWFHDHHVQPAVRRLDKYLRLRAAHRRTSRSPYTSCPHLGNERRQLPPETI
jgi:imidazolonepropionase-like amidohydrolase